MTGRTLVALLALSLALPAAAQQRLDAPPTVPEGNSAPAPAAPAKRDTLASDARAATYEIGEIMSAADGAFGEATENVAKVIERVFADLGRPNAYIVGREGGGAVVVGLRYGRGRLFHKVEGEREVFWTGPSLGPDLGGDASRSFVLVYNLHDTEDLFRRFPAVEGKAYLIGGVSANYHRRGDIVLVPIRLGAGWRLGANLGYLRYTKEGRVLPF
jgi:hypothetical protein